MVSPYSVSVPGGVQAQVMGLARELRRIGHEVRVLAPCDGPPPEPFVTPLGKSLPTAANGSVAPLAPDPSAALRTIRALNDEAFDIIHLHEPIAPGPTATALLLQLAPTVGTFHAAGDSSSYRVLNKTARWAADQLSTRVAVSASAKELAHRYLGGNYTVLFNGSKPSVTDVRPWKEVLSQQYFLLVVMNRAKGWKFCLMRWQIYLQTLGCGLRPMAKVLTN